MPSTETRYVLGPYTVDVAARVVTRDGTPLKLAHRHFEALKLLVEANQSIVPKEKFFQALWPDTPLVDESNLTQCISQLRKALGNGDRTPFIETVPRVGYRLLVPVTSVNEAVQDPAADAPRSAASAASSLRWRRLAAAGIVIAVMASAGAAAVRWWQTRPARLSRAAQERAAEARRRDDAKAATRELQLAIQLDPRNGRAYGELAHALHKQRFRASPIGQSPSVQAAARGVEIDPECGVCHGTFGFFLFYHDWQWARAGPHYERALQLSPESHGIRASYALLLTATGRLPEALDQIDIALRHDPYQVGWHSIRASILYSARRYDESIAAADKGIAISAQEPDPWQWRSKAWFQLGRGEDAVKALAEGPFASSSSELGAAVREGGSRAALARLLDITGDWDGRTEQAWRRSQWRALLDDTEGALIELEKAYELRHVNLLYVGVEPLFDRIREQPRFQKILQGMGLRGASANE